MAKADRHSAIFVLNGGDAAVFVESPFDKPVSLRLGGETVQLVMNDGVAIELVPPSAQTLAQLRQRRDVIAVCDGAETVVTVVTEDEPAS